MPRSLPVRLTTSQEKQLQQMAAQLGVSPEEFLATLVGEKLREESFPHIEFRTRGGSRDAYLQGHRLAVWEIARITRDLDGEPPLCADYLHLPLHLVEAALSYANAYPDEIQALIEEVEAITVEDLKRLIPSLIVYEG